MREYKYSVCVKCPTYNHELYIKDTLEGFVSQITAFPVVYIIIDDASTDSTASVISHFVDERFDLSEDGVAFDKLMDHGRVTYARHKTNKNCFFSVLYLNENHFQQRKPKSPYFLDWINKSKYIALCEGDDFWIDPCKLQKQVDFLERNPEYVMVCHNAILMQGKRTSLFNGLEKGSHTIELQEMIKKWSIPTASLLFRNNMDIYPPNYPGYNNGDYALELLLGLKGLLYYMMLPMSVYRRHSDSVSGEMERNQLVLYKGLVDLLNYMKELYPEKDNVLFDEAIAGYQNEIDKIQKDKKYPFLKYFNWRFYKRLLFKKLKLVRVDN